MQRAVCTAEELVTSGIASLTAPGGGPFAETFYRTNTVYKGPHHLGDRSRLPPAMSQSHHEIPVLSQIAPRVIPLASPSTAIFDVIFTG
jgi:hypothetical protein